MSDALKFDPRRIYIIHGKDPLEMVRLALEKLNLAGELHPGMKIGLKPNLALSKPASSGATTSPEIIEGIVRYLKAHGMTRIVVLESSAVGYSTRDAYRISGIEAVAAKYQVEIKDLKNSPVRRVQTAGFDLDIFEDAFGLDYLINVPVVKAHCQAGITCALKNLKGLIPDREKRRFHRLGLHRPIAALNAAVKTDLVIADGIQGDLMFEEGGNPVRMDRILIGKDPVRMDSFVAHSLGYGIEEVPYIQLARDLGVGEPLADFSRVIELNRDFQPLYNLPRAGATVRRLSQGVSAREACSVCYGNLLHALYKTERMGKRKGLNGPFYIGQGFKEKNCEGTGIGTCTRGFSRFLPGCPPGVHEIVSFILN